MDLRQVMKLRAVEESKKEFLKVFREMCYSRSGWQVWADLITAMACSIANVTDRRHPVWKKREDEYMDCIGRLGGVEKPAQCFAQIVNALDQNPNQDFLGELYMELELGNHWKGQFFTPYSICRMMSEITIDENIKDKIEQQGYIAVNDCACGAGATLVAAANTFRYKKIQFQNHILFTAQDIDRVVGMMCYIQLSLLGCAGYVVIADSITNPMVRDALFPVEQKGQEFWYTPLWFSDIWQGRRLWRKIDRMMKPLTEKKIELPNGNGKYFFFDFSKEITI